MTSSPHGDLCLEIQEGTLQDAARFPCDLMELWGFLLWGFFFILSSAAVTVFSCPGSVTIRCDHSGDGGGGGRAVSLHGTNVGMTHPCSAGSTSSVPNTLGSWKQSLATPQPCREGQGTEGLEKIP